MRKRYYYLLGVFLLAGFLVVPIFKPSQVRAEVWCQCCSDSNCGTIIGSCADTDRNDGRPSCCGDIGGNDNYTSGCGDVGSGGGGDSGGGATTPTATPIPVYKVCGEPCGTGPACLPPLTCQTDTNLGTRVCRYPNAPADETCRQGAVCNSVCRSNDGCGSQVHTIKIVNKPNSDTQKQTNFDTVSDDGQQYDTYMTPGYFSYTGVWSDSGYSAGYVAGKAKRTTEAGASISFKTTSRKVTAYLSKAAHLGSAEVYVDGVLRKTENLNSATVVIRYPIVIETEADNGFVCYGTTNPKVCRKATFPTSATCEPQPAPVCSGLSMSTAATGTTGLMTKMTSSVAKVTGDATAGRIFTYEGKCDVYRLPDIRDPRRYIQAPQGDLITTVKVTPTAVGSNLFTPLVIRYANANYECKYRVCYTTTTNKTPTCTEWGQ